MCIVPFMNFIGEHSVWSVFILSGVTIIYMPMNARLVSSTVLLIAISSGYYSYMGLADHILFCTWSMCPLLWPHYLEDIWLQVVQLVHSIIGIYLLNLPVPC